MANEAPTETARSRVREFRTIIANTIGELRGTEARNSYVAITLEEMATRHADRLDKGTEEQPSRLARITAVHAALAAKIAEIKAAPPDLFRKPDPSTDVNTPP